MLELIDKSKFCNSGFCVLCGYSGSPLCQPCADWQPIAAAAEAAIEYAKQCDEARE